MKKLLRKVFGKKSKFKPADKDSRLVDYTKPYVSPRGQEFYKLMKLALTSQWDRLAGVLQLSTDRVRDLIKLPPIGGCSHLKAKGPYKNEEIEFSQKLSVDEHGRVGPLSKDYDVYLHTFIDRSQRIHCRRCGQNWFPGQPDWDKAVEMTRQSTNRASASESPIFNINTPEGREGAKKWLDIGRVLNTADDGPIVIYQDSIPGITEEAIQEEQECQ